MFGCKFDVFKYEYEYNIHDATHYRITNYITNRNNKT